MSATAPGTARLPEAARQSGAPGRHAGAADFLAGLRRRDIEVRLEGDRLHCNAPAGALDPALRAELKERRDEIVAFLRAAASLARQQRAIVPLVPPQPDGRRCAVFAVPGHNGDVFCYRALAQCLGGDQPFFGLQPPGLDKDSAPLESVAALAAYLAGQVRAFQPEGPYLIAGYCAGGTVAYELAQQLQAQGAAVPLVALIASPWPQWYGGLPQLRYRLGREVERCRNHLRALATLPGDELATYVATKLRQRRKRRQDLAATRADPALAQRHDLEAATLAAVCRYMPRAYAGRVALFIPDGTERRKALLRWRDVAPAAELHQGPPQCTGDDMLLHPNVGSVGEQFLRCIAQGEGGADAPPGAAEVAAVAGLREAIAAPCAQPIGHA